MRKVLLRTLILAIVLVTIGVVSLSFKQPINDRVWDPAFSKLNTIEFSDDGALTIHNLRDFTYAAATTTAREWKDVTVHPEDIESVWFFLDHFKPSTPQVGHTFVSFRMKDGSTIAFSIEARREATETYSFIGGFVRDFELQYLWGTERDLVSQRVVLKNEQLYLFPLTVTHAQAMGLMKEFAKETNVLAQQPRWYHTLTANCTNLLATIVNTYQPGMLPYDISWNLTGLADGYLEKQGFIDTHGKSQEEERATHDLTKHRDDTATHTTDTPEAFSTYIRTLLSD